MTGTATPPPRRSAPRANRLAVGVVGLVALGALLLLVAEFTPLFTIHIASRRGAIATTNTGSHHHYALVPLALLGFVLGLAASSTGSRAALGGVIAVGLAALLIGLLHDLPDAQGSGVVREAANLVNAKASPAVGMYLETLGAVVMIVGGVAGLLLAPPATRRPEASAPARRRAAGPRR